MKKEIFILILITLLAAALRLYRLDSRPPALNWDEISHGYNAYSILTTGKDEWGQPFPVSFRAYGDYKLPGYIYLDVPFIAIFGLNAWGVRLPSALAGVATVILTYFLVARLFPNSPNRKKSTIHQPARHHIALLSALFLAISPWHLHFSRGAFEANLALFFAVAAAFFFLKGLEKPSWLFLSALFFSASFYTYLSARIVVPALILVLIVVYREELKRAKRQLVLSGLLLVLLAAPLLPLFASQAGSARYQLVALADSGWLARIHEARARSELPVPIVRLIHNRPVAFVRDYLKNYLTNFSFEFLFVEGEPNDQRSVRTLGVLYFWELPALLAGLYLIARRRGRGELAVLGWLLVSPLAAAATRENPHALRGILALPAYQIITALGVVEIANFASRFSPAKKWFGFSVALLALFVNVFYYLETYHHQYPKAHSKAWQYENQEAAKFVASVYDQYDRIIIDRLSFDEAYMYMLFFLKIPPERYQTDPNLRRYFRENWFWVDSFDKFEFPDKIFWDEVKMSPNTLLVGHPNRFPDEVEALATINYLDGKEALKIVKTP